jgi:hypothetical protein
MSLTRDDQLTPWSRGEGARCSYAHPLRLLRHLQHIEKLIDVRRGRISSALDLTEIDIGQHYVCWSVVCFLSFAIESPSAVPGYGRREGSICSERASEEVEEQKPGQSENAARQLNRSAA